jgi:hypothetical protein
VNRKTTKVCLAAAVLVPLLFFGCGPKGPILVSMSYRAPQDLVEETRKVVVGVSPLRDERGTSASVLGRRSQASSNQGNDLVVQGTVSDIATTALKDAIERRGFAVKDVPEWDLPGGAAAVKGVDILVGGGIKNLRLDAVTKTVKVSYKVDVQLRMSAADASERRVFRKLMLNCAMEREDVKFSVSRAESLLSEALSSAIDQLMDDEEFRKNLR